METTVVNKKIDSLQMFRGFAALGVVFHHAALSSGSLSADKIPSTLDRILQHGYLGVDFFFVLSGFIILNSHFDDVPNYSYAKIYFTKRLTRIFPPYLPISIIMLIAYAGLPGVSAGNREPISLISSLFLLPSSGPPALSVAWTLVHEMMFYFVFLIFFINTKLFIVSIASWVTVILGTSSIFSIDFVTPFFRVLFHPLNLEFVLGMIAAYGWRTFGKNSRLGFWYIVAGAAIFFMLVGRVSGQSRFLFGVPFSLMVFGGALLDLNGRLSIPKIFILFGDASYSIYLIHNPLISFVSRSVRYFWGSSSWYIMSVTGVCSSLLLGIMYHKIVEKPAIRLAKLIGAQRAIAEKLPRDLTD